MTDDIRAEIARLEAEVAQQQAMLAGLEADVTELEHELLDFQQRYDRLVAPLVTRLKAVREAVEELEHRHYVEQRMGEPPSTAPSPPPPTNYLPVEEQYRRAWERKEPADETPPATQPRRAEGSLKDLYRLLARRYHPDFASDEADRERRNHLMAMINEAYTANDFEALKLLAEQPEAASTEASLAALRLRHLRQTYDQLARRIEQAKQARVGLIHHDLMRLKVEEKLAKRQGRDLLGEMVEQMEQEYWGFMAQLEKLRRA